MFLLCHHENPQYLFILVYYCVNQGIPTCDFLKIIGFFINPSLSVFLSTNVVTFDIVLSFSGVKNLCDELDCFEKV